MNWNTYTAHELLDFLKQGKVSAQEIFSSLSSAIKQQDKTIHAYVRTAETADILSDARIPIPISVKDNINIDGWETTCSSHILKNYVAPYDATVVRKLKAAGAPILGHTNMDEFAFGSSTETSCYGPTRNPWDISCVPGGSSGGSAAAVASDEAIWALGSDTGGSIRQPAAFCGVVGLKPTYGRVSRYGLIAFASSLDQIGPLTKDVTDSALLLNIISGHDPLDSTSADIAVPDYTAALVNDCKELTIGIPKEYFIEGISSDVKTAVAQAMNVLKAKGARFIDVSLPHTEYAVSTYYIIAPAEASSNLARFDGVRFGLRVQPAKPRKAAIVDMYEETRNQGFGREAKRRVMLGTYALSSGYYDAYYLRGQKVRTLIRQDFDRVFENCDAILTPTTPTSAFKIGEKLNDPVSMYLSDIFTISANLSGIPAISIPCGISQNGLPIGLQLSAKPFAEEILFRIAYTYEQNTGWHKKRPSLKT